MKNKYRFEDGTVYFLDSSSTLKMVRISRDQEWTFRLDWRGKTFPVNARRQQTGTPPRGRLLSLDDNGTSGQCLGRPNGR